MDLFDKLYDLSAKSLKIKGSISTEEATKNALILPFIRALGYDIFNPDEVVPEHTADVLGRKKEKVDYALFIDGRPTVVIECKICGEDLNAKHTHQLYRYFGASEARIAILTDGIIYKLYSDLDKPNVMDLNPFMIFDLKSIDEGLVSEMKKISRDRFDLEATLSSANELKYSRALSKYIISEMEKPSDEFVKFFASKVYTGKLVATAVKRFKEIVPAAFEGAINSLINDRLKLLMKKDALNNEEMENDVEKGSVVTTDEERDAYYIVRAIVSEVCPLDRIADRDQKTYFGILFDDNNRKPVCRLHFNSKQKYIGLFPDSKDEEKVTISRVEDIFIYSEKIKAAAIRYLNAEEEVTTSQA